MNKQADWSRFAQVHGKAGEQVTSHDPVFRHSLQFVSSVNHLVLWSVALKAEASRTSFLPLDGIGF